jgi:hypothetical protein
MLWMLFGELIRMRGQLVHDLRHEEEYHVRMIRDGM